MNIAFDFTQAASRSAIEDQLFALMDEQAVSRHRAILEGAVVPEEHHHGIVEVRRTIASLDVPEPVRASLASTYEILAAAEAKVHGVEVDHTHFHEVGNASGIRNALSICAAFYVLNPNVVRATALQVGSGAIECAHGLMQVPAPATAAIIERFGLPVCESRLSGELCTPTSAALIANFVKEFV